VAVGDDIDDLPFFDGDDDDVLLVRLIKEACFFTLGLAVVAVLVGLRLPMSADTDDVRRFIMDICFFMLNGPLPRPLSGLLVARLMVKFLRKFCNEHCLASRWRGERCRTGEVSL
jgi:hypothetical protein